MSETSTGYPPDMVLFNMPDGTKVSNDPRFGLQEALQAMLDSTVYTGSAGINPDDQEATMQATHVASINSGQPGVGENAVQDNPTRDLHGQMGSPAQQAQSDDLKAAQEAGGSPAKVTTADDEDEPVDSNEAVLQERAKRQAKAEKAQEALEESGEGPGDPEKPYSEWSGKQLVAEVHSRNAESDRAEEDRLTFDGNPSKDQVIEALDADNDRKAAAQS